MSIKVKKTFVKNILGSFVVIAFAFLSYPSIYSHRVFESVFGSVPALSNLAAASAPSVPAPELPRVYVDTSMPSQTGSTLYVANNCSGVSSPCSTNLQTTLNSAQPGDTIILKAGDTFTGTFVLTNKGSSNQWIIIQSSKLSSLPPSGTRVSPSDAVNMPTISAGNSTPNVAVMTNSQANHYRFIGIRFAAGNGVFSGGLFRIGGSNSLQETSVSQLPHDITLDRVIISADPNAGGSRGVALNGRMLAVVDSYINGWKDSNDAQALMGWNGAEGYKIVNNYLEGSAENIMFGGAASTIQNVNPSDIEIRNNYFYKPISWQSISGVTIKNLFELKVGERVLLEGNVMDGSWAGAQNGKAINLKSTNSGSSWSHTGDVTIRYNIIRNVGQVMSLIGIYPGPVITMNNVEFSNNLVEKINIPPYSGTADMFSFGASSPLLPNIIISHNTVVSTGSITSIATLSAGSATNVIFDNNILTNGVYGIKTSGIASGDPSLNSAFTNYSFRNNALIGGSGTVGAGTLFPVNISAVGFSNSSGGNYALSGGPLKNAGTDGKDIGADIATINQKTSGVISGNSSGGQVYVPPPVVIPPTPTLTLSASNTSITLGQSVTLTWSTTNATSCTASGGWSGLAALSGSQSVTPTQTSTYTLICGSASQAVTVTVVQPITAPPITTPPPPVTVTPPTTPPPATPNVGNGMNDTFPPSIPDRLTAFTSHAGELTVRWDPSFDRGGIGGYKVYRDSAQVGDTLKEEYIDKGLTPNQSYTYAVSAYDRSGNSSSQSSSRTFKVDSSVTTPTVVTPTETSTPTFSFTKNLRYGQENSDVLALQNKLKSLGYFSASVTPNGYFGRQTLTAVIKYQRAMGLSTTGFVGPMTRGRLNTQ